MTQSTLRIVSLLPSATELVAALGFGDWLVGRSHECDYPEGVQALPICTQPKFNPEGTSIEIHDRVTELLQSALSVYRIETEVLKALQPTHIVTQAQCEVCAVSLSDVEKVVHQLTDAQPQIISLQPRVLADLWTDLERVLTQLTVDDPEKLSQGRGTIAALQQRVQTCHDQVRSLSPCPRVACIEWVDPLMAAGNWVPELVTLAGGQSLFGEVGQHSPWLQWADLQAADPDLILFMPCGFDLARTLAEVEPLLSSPPWQLLTAVQTGQVYAVDGNQYFNRPGPRLVDSLEILAEILQAATVKFGYEGRGWQRVKI